MNSDRIEADLAAIEGDASLGEEMNLEARVWALARLDFVDELVRLRSRSEDWRALGQRADAQRRRLDRANERLFERARARIRTGRGTDQELRARQALRARQELRAWLASFAVLASPQAGDDPLDALFDGVLGLDRVPQPTQTLDREMVPLEPSPARVILELVDRVPWRPEDGFYDLGSGLGQVAIWVHLLAGVWAVGIEVEPAYCRAARTCAHKLNLSGVTIVQGDARSVDLSQGTVFYLFTPFTGEMLQAVLDRLHDEAQERSIWVCSYGPCAKRVAQQPWLERVGQDVENDFELAVFRKL